MGFSFLYQKSRFNALKQILMEKPDVIYLGNSKFLSGIMPEAIKRETGLSGYNASANGSGIVFAKGLESVILSYYRPKIFVIQVMPLSSERGAMSRLAPYLHNSGVKNLLSYYPYNIRIKYGLLKTSRYNSMLVVIIKGLFGKLDSQCGYRPLFGSLSQKRSRQVRSSIETNFPAQFGETLLRNFIEEARRNQVEIIMVEMPILKQEKNDGYDTYGNFAKIYNIPLINLSKKSDTCLQSTKEYFWDKFHLNNKGVTVFSAVLGEEINKFIKNNP